MNQRNTSTPETLEFSTLAHAAHVFAPLALCYVLLAGPTFFLSGSRGLVAAAVAALLCVFASVGASAAASLLAASGQVVAATMLAMSLRMALPLVFVVIVCRKPGPLVDAGLVYYLLGFYMVALLADTWHAVGRLAAISKTAVSKATVSKAAVSRGA